MEDEFYTVKEIAKRLKTKDFTVIDWIRKRELPAYKVGREYRIRRIDFEKFLENRRTDKKDD